MKLENQNEYQSTLTEYKEIREFVWTETEAIQDVETALSDEGDGNLSSMISIMFELEDDLIDFEKRNNLPVTTKTNKVFNEGQRKRVLAMVRKYREDLSKTTDAKKLSELQGAIDHLEKLLAQYEDSLKQPK